MDKITHEVRLAKWVKVIEQCQARPEGQTATQWCAENGISRRQYYYWLRKVRQAAYDQAASSGLLPKEKLSSSVAPVNEEPNVSFSEIPYSVSELTPSETVFQPTAEIKTGTVSVTFSNAVSQGLLSCIICLFSGLNLAARLKTTKRKILTKILKIKLPVSF